MTNKLNNVLEFWSSSVSTKIYSLVFVLPKNLRSLKLTITEANLGPDW